MGQAIRQQLIGFAPDDLVALAFSHLDAAQSENYFALRVQAYASAQTDVELRVIFGESR